MLRLISMVVLLTCSVTLSAQKKKTATAADPKKYAASITPEDLSRHLYIVAGAEMEGRETATEGQKKAAAYIENHFRSLGLLPGNNGSFQQLYPVYNDANIICIPARFVNIDLALGMVDTFLSTAFEGGRHLNRVQKIKIDSKAPLISALTLWYGLPS